MKKLLSILLLVSAMTGSILATAQTPTCNPELTATVNSSNSLNYSLNNATVLSASNTPLVYFFLNIAKQNGTTWNYINPPSIGGAGTSTSYTFGSPGYYRLVLQMSDSSTSGYCVNSDTLFLTVVGPVINTAINGYVIPSDTMQSYPALSYKVWLIQYNQGTNILSAVDSQTIYSNSTTGTAYYSFASKPAGDYLVKAKELSNFQLSNGNYMVPTYHNSSNYWSSAQTIVHTTANNSYAGIFMLSANAPSTGPGFIAGNVYQGANRTATPNAVGDPVQGLNVYLKNGSGQVVKFVTTDINGYFQFGSLPLDNYTVFPEELGLTTFPAPIQINSTSTNYSNLIFDQNATQIKYRTTGLANIKVDVAAIYPNPVKSTLFVQWKEKPAACRMQIMNFLGQELQSFENSPSEISLKALPSGIYMLKITTDKGSQTLKFQKQ